MNAKNFSSRQQSATDCQWQFRVILDYQDTNLDSAILCDIATDEIE